jgi:hypothetical protein
MVQKTVNDSQGLRHGHAGLFLRESIQSLQDRLDLTIPQQLLRELLCNRFRGGRHDYRTILLTESSSANLFLRYGEYRNQLYHYLRDDIRHQRAQRDLGVYMETIEEVAKVFK